MLLGEYSHTIDDKGRLAIPVKLRKELGEGAVITRGTDRCLVVYPKAEWQTLATKIAALPLSDARARSFSRLMMAGAMAVEFDKQGRALLPGYLKDYAGLQDHATVAGVYNRLEIWDTTAWEAYKQHHSIDENLSEFGV
jgi:MraZ protein